MENRSTLELVLIALIGTAGGVFIGNYFLKKFDNRENNEDATKMNNDGSIIK